MSPPKYAGRWSQAAAWWAFLAGCITLPWTAIQASSIPASDLLFALAAALLLLSPGRPYPRPAPALLVGATCCLAATLLAAYNAVDVRASTAIGVRILWLFTIWAWTVRRLVATTDRLVIVAGAYCVGAALSAAVAVWQVRTGSELVTSRAAGLTGHVNDAGGTLAIAAALATALIAYGTHRWFSAAALAAAVVGLVLSGSVSGMAAGIGGVLTVAVLRRVRPAFIIGAATATAAAWWVVGKLPDAVNPLSRLAETTSATGTGTLQLRLETWRFAWQGIVAHPLNGVGLDQVSGGTIIYSGSGTAVLATHNLLLLAWFQGGLLLFFSFVTVLAGSARRIAMVRGIRLDVAAAAWVTVFTFGMTAPVLFQRYFWFPILLGFAVARTGRTSPRDEPEPAAARSEAAEQVAGR